MNVDRIWWREITPGDYKNIEKALTGGPTGQLHIDVPKPSALLTFLGLDPLLPAEDWESVTVPAGVVGDPAVVAPITFRPRVANNRFDIPRQNANHHDSVRHPAWTVDYGWPIRPGGVAGNDEAAEVTSLGLHIYVVRTTEEQYFAGFTTGRQLPAGWPSQTRDLFEGRTAGVIQPATASGVEDLSPLTAKILDALQRRKNVLVYGPPGTGKTHAVAQAFRLAQLADGLESLNFDPANLAAPFSLESNPIPLPQPVRADWVTFHQDYGYEDFVIGLRPAGEDGMKLEPQAGRLLDAAIRIHEASAASALLVVDEINRGNVPKILGDFLTFMDEGYRAKSDGETAGAIPVNLPKLRVEEDGSTESIRLASGGETRLPSPWYFPREVYLLATMNSVDRAVAPLDTAMGRRFVRIDAPPDITVLAEHLEVDMESLLSARPAAVGADRTEPVTDEGESAFTEEPLDDDGPEDGEAPQAPTDPTTWTVRQTACLLLLRLNDEIAERLGSDFELGHLYFWNVEGWTDLQSVWDNDIWPQLRDRFGARPDQLAEILKVDSSDRPANYPFRRRTPRGSALAVSPLGTLPPQEAAQVLRFLSRR